MSGAVKGVVGLGLLRRSVIPRMAAEAPAPPLKRNRSEPAEAPAAPPAPPAVMTPVMFPRLTGTPLHGQTVALAGRFAEKKALEALLVSHGAKLCGSVSSIGKTSMVVVGVNPGDKLGDGLVVGARIISEKDLRDALAAGEVPEERAPEWSAGFWANNALTDKEKFCLTAWCRGALADERGGHPMIAWPADTAFSQGIGRLPWPGVNRVGAATFFPLLRRSHEHICLYSEGLTVADLAALMAIVASRAGETYQVGRYPIKVFHAFGFSGHWLSDDHLAVIATWLPRTTVERLDIVRPGMASDPLNKLLGFDAMAGLEEGAISAAGIGAVLRAASNTTSLKYLGIANLRAEAEAAVAAWRSESSKEAAFELDIRDQKGK